MSQVMPDTLIQLLNLLLVHDDLAVKLTISFLEEAIFRLKHANVLFKLDLATLVVVDHLVFEHGDHVLSVHLQVRIVEAELVLQKRISDILLCSHGLLMLCELVLVFL